MKHCCEIAFTHFFFIITKNDFLYLPLDQKMTTLTVLHMDWITTSFCENSGFIFKRSGPLRKQHPTKGRDARFTLQLYCLDLILRLYLIEHSLHINFVWRGARPLISLNFVPSSEKIWQKMAVTTKENYSKSLHIFTHKEFSVEILGIKLNWNWAVSVYLIE